MIGTEDEVAERIARFAASGVDRLIISPMHAAPEDQIATINKLAELTTTTGSPA